MLVANNHGSLGLFSEANHGSAFSAANKAYQYKAGTIKQPKPKILVHEGQTLRNTLAQQLLLNDIGNNLLLQGTLDRALSSDNLGKEQSHFKRQSLNAALNENLRSAQRIIQQRSKSHEELEEDENNEQARGKIKVEESLFRANITQEIEDINKKSIFKEAILAN